MSEDLVAGNTHGNLDEQIAQLMLCKPLSDPEVKKEKLGERVTALQQLVSPLGKTDTASVLHEAMGYIRFLQDQVQVLCSPYIHSLPEDKEITGKSVTETRNDLRSKGLCLVPVELTLHVVDSNGADFWSSAMVNNLLSN